MNYMTVKEASELWEIDISTIGKLLRAGKIPQATKIGGHWVMPKDTPRVPDGRTKAAKAASGKAEKNEFFRFPLLVNGEENNFVPSLSTEEKTLRQAELEFLACDFDNSKKKLKKLSEDAGNIYVRMMSYFWLCWLSAAIYNGNQYNDYFMNLEQALANDFKNRREMTLLLPWLYSGFTQYRKAAEYLDYDIYYDYSPSVLPIMSFLICADKISIENPDALAMRANLYEITVRSLRDSGNIFEAQLIHLLLFIFYFTAVNEEQMVNHLKSAMEIAYKYNFIFFVADCYPYYTAVFNRVLDDYPKKFADTLKERGLQIYKSFSTFSKKNHISEIFSSLSNSDIKLVLYAAQEYSNKKVAEIIHVSERTVANRYAEIYDKLGVEGKQGLLKRIK